VYDFAHTHTHAGHVGAYLIIGGVDATGPRLVSVSASGNSTLAPFLADGSGSYAAISIFEKDYVFNMTVRVRKL
jgi:20S proteasome subunit beta 2